MISVPNTCTAGADEGATAGTPGAGTVVDDAGSGGAAVPGAGGLTGGTGTTVVEVEVVATANAGGVGLVPPFGKVVVVLVVGTPIVVGAELVVGLGTVVVTVGVVVVVAVEIGGDGVSVTMASPSLLVGVVCVGVPNVGGVPSGLVSGGSEGLGATNATFFRVGPAPVTVATTVMLTVPRGSSGPAPVHVTVDAPLTHTTPVPVDDTAVVPAGSKSVMVQPALAVPGPSLVTTTV